MRGLALIAVLGAMVPVVVPDASADAATVTSHTRVVDISASGTISVQRGMTIKPSKPCPAADHPNDAAAPHRPPEVPDGLVGIGISEGKAVGLCRYEQAAVLAFSELTLPEGAVLTSARLELEIESLSEATELQLTSTFAEPPTDQGFRQDELPPAGSMPTVAGVTGAGPVELDATAAVDSLLSGTGNAFLLRGVSGRALVQGHDAADAPRLTLTYEEAVDPVDDSEPPTVKIVSPTAGATLFGDVVIEVEASDNLGIDEVGLTLGGQWVASATAPPYTFEVDTRTVLDGEQPLVAEVRDRGGNTARALLPVFVDNSGGPLSWLDVDLASGRIDIDTYLTEGMRLVLGVGGGSSRYEGELPAEVTIWTWTALELLPEASAATQAQVEEWITPVDLDAASADSSVAVMDTAEARVAVSATSPEVSALAAASVSVGEPGCGRRFIFFGTYGCTIDVGGVTVHWEPKDFETVAAGEVPARIDDAVTGFRDAQDVMSGSLEWKSIGHVDAYVGGGGFEGRAISLPNHVMLLSKTDSSIAATSAHELMHQYQYKYLDALDTYRPLDSTKDARLRRIGWLMEASAEWGAHQTMASRPWNYSGEDLSTYYRNIGVFLNDPNADLMMWTVSTNRQYGAFPVVEWVASKEGAEGVRLLWEELDRTGSVLDAFSGTMGGFETKLPDMWQDLYLLDLAGPGVSTSTTNLWRDELADTLDLEPYERVTGNRPLSRSVQLGQGDSTVVDVALDPGGAEFIEVNVSDSQAVTVLVDTTASEGSLGMRVLPLAEYDLDPATGPDLCTIVSGTTFIYDPDLCDGLSLVVANTSLLEAAVGRVSIQVGNRVDTTITNGLVRLGINREGQLNAAGFDASSGTGTTTVGLRYEPTNADALSPGCECEGWGIADIGLDIGGSANQSYGGATGLVLKRASFDARSGTSVVTTTDGAFTVTHEFLPAVQTANLYEVRVTVANTTSFFSLLHGGYYGTLAPTYRRVMDWDVEPTAFSEYVTIGARDGILPPEIVATTDDGFASADPRRTATDLGGRGLFTDLGPADHGALFDIALPELDPGESYTFSMYYGAAASSAAAESALRLVDADAWSLAEPDVVDGAQLGQPNTFMFGLRFPRPILAARVSPEVLDGAAESMRTASTEIARYDGEPRQ